MAGFREEWWSRKSEAWEKIDWGFPLRFRALLHSCIPGFPLAFLRTTVSLSPLSPPPPALHFQTHVLRPIKLVIEVPLSREERRSGFLDAWTVDLGGDCLNPGITKLTNKKKKNTWYVFPFNLDYWSYLHLSWSWPLDIYFLVISVSGPRCYECTGPVRYEECPVRRCIFNDGKCYYAVKPPDFVAEHGCTRQQHCNKTKVDGKYILCCEGDLCNKGKWKGSDIPRQNELLSWIYLIVS